MALRRVGTEEEGRDLAAGAHQTYEKMQEIGWECAVVGVPKTIDNDINLLDHLKRDRNQVDLGKSRPIFSSEVACEDRSFGFDTAMCLVFPHAQAQN